VVTDVERAWAEALALWGVRLQPPQLVPDAGEPSFAWFRFPPQVSVDLPAARRAGVAVFLPSILAHEVGHHVLSPSTRVAGQKITLQLARALTVSRDLPPAAVPELAARLGNLWSDLLINVVVAERQQRADPTAEPEMVRVWRVLAAGDESVAPAWWLVLRAYEHLWRLPAGELAGPLDRAALAPGLHPELDADLLAETVRRFATDPVTGALRFGLLVAPYLPDPPAGGSGGAAATPEAGCGGERDAAPPTAAELDDVLADPRLAETPVHPAEAAARARGLDPAEGLSGSGPGGQAYGLAETRALWPAANPDTVTAAWYAAAARRWVRPLLAPVPPDTPAGEGIPGPLETWENDDDPTTIDWPGTLAAGPRVVPGVTTRRRTTVDEPPPTRRASVRLDLYLDGSGSMPAPAEESPAVLAATILVASVLRAPGGRVRVTTFSGPGEVAGTSGFTRDRAAATAAVLHYPGGGTTFPLDLLAVRAAERGPASEPGGRHLVVLSDDGLESMFGVGQPRHAGVAARVAAGLTTATLLLLDPSRRMAEVAAQAGFRVHYLDRLEDAPTACAALAADLLAGSGG
jgi:hypothetical protein